MFKLNKIELKKIFLRPAVYVMLFVLAGVLVVSGLMYSSSPKINPQTNFGGANQTISMAFSEFNSSSSVDAKPSLDQALETAKTAVETYASQSSLYQKMTDSINRIDYTLSKNDPQENTFKHAMLEYAQAQTQATKDAYIASMEETALLADSLYKLCKTEITEAEIDFFITTVDLQLIQDYSQSLYLAFPSTDDLETFTREALVELGNNICDNYLPTTEKQILTNAEKIQFSTEEQNQILQKYYLPVVSSTSGTVLSGIYAEIEQFVADNADSQAPEDREAFNQLTTKYKLASQTAVNLIYDEFALLKSNGLSDATLRAYIGFEHFNSYNLKQNITLNNYLLENQIFDGKYLTGFNFNSASGYSSNAYDFTVFAMQILFVVLTLFGMFFAVTTMAGDFQNGAIKMLATRPIKRTSIVGGKTLASINFTLIFAVFCLIASFVVGYAMFGLGTESVMITVFNAQSVMVCHPAVMLGLYFILGMLNVVFFIVLAVLLAVIFRSSLGAMFISLIVYVAYLVLSAVLSGATWFMFTPFAYLDLFRFMGGAGAGGFLTFSSTIGFGFWISLLVLLLMIVLVDILSKLIFKKRDIT